MSISHRGKRRLYALVGLLALGLTACSGGPQNALEPDGEFALKADQLWDVTIGIAIVIFFIVEGLLVFTLFKFRHKPGREAAQFHGNTKLEIALTLIPALILLGLSIPTVQTILELQGSRPEGAMEIKVIGHQFWWEYQYPGLGPDGGDLITANELHIPTGQDIYLLLEGLEDDVNHSFWVPRLAGTQDIIPGRQNHLLLRADKPDEYLGQCKEYCGLSHANMRLRVFADTPGDFQTWLAEQQEEGVEPPSGGQVADGQKAFLENACVGCHAIGGTEAAANVGPNLTHLASRKTFAGAMLPLTEENLRAWVADAPSVKPGSRMPSGIKELGLSQQEVDDIVAYLMTLK